MKHQVLFSLKNNEKIFMNVVCCSRDWRLRVNIQFEETPSITTQLNNQKQSAYIRTDTLTGNMILVNRKSGIFHKNILAERVDADQSVLSFSPIFFLFSKQFS